MKQFIFCLILLFSVSLRAEEVRILTQGSKSFLFNVELAETPLKRAMGLMNREDLPEREGMLFLFPTKENVTMWMKDTYIPLDMLFFDETGQITSLIENARPLDMSLLHSQEPVKGVLEIKGGSVRSLGIQVGDVIETELLSQNAY